MERKEEEVRKEYKKCMANGDVEEISFLPETGLLRIGETLQLTIVPSHNLCCRTHPT